MRSTTSRLLRSTPLALVACLGAAGCRRGTSAPARTTPAPRPAAPRGITSGADVLERMHATYGARAPRNVSFVQANTVYLGSGQVQQQWRIVVAPPGRMRMDYLPLTSRTGFLYVGDDAWSFQNGRRSTLQAQVNPTLFLAFGVFAQPVGASRRLLDSLGVRSTLVRRDTTGGRPAWVIGAEAGDLSSDQVWVDAERWVPLRLIDRETRGTRTTVTDTRFTEYLDAGGLPVARTLLVYRDRKLALKQELREVKVNVALPELAFDPAHWVDAQPPR
jgi:outer membrane lipoprotein-sorting protein